MSTETNVTTNPLANYRAPRRLPKNHAPVEGQHFVTRREDVCNDTSMLNIYPGDFTYIRDSSLELDFALWEESDTTQSINVFMIMTERKGYSVAQAKDFKTSERVKIAWRKDAAGRLTFGGMSKNSLVLMWRTGAKRDEVEAQSLRWSNEIAKSFEEKMAEAMTASTENSSARLGADIKSTVTIEDDEEVVRS